MSWSTVAVHRICSSHLFRGLANEVQKIIWALSRDVFLCFYWQHCTDPKEKPDFSGFPLLINPELKQLQENIPKCTNHMHIYMGSAILVMFLDMFEKQPSGDGHLTTSEMVPRSPQDCKPYQFSSVQFSQFSCSIFKNKTCAWLHTKCFLRPA